MIDLALRCGVSEAEIVSRVRVDGGDGGYDAAWLCFRGADAFDPARSLFTETALALTASPRRGLRMWAVDYLCEYLGRAGAVMTADHREVLHGLARDQDQRTRAQARRVLGWSPTT